MRPHKAILLHSSCRRGPAGLTEEFSFILPWGSPGSKIVNLSCPLESAQKAILHHFPSGHSQKEKEELHFSFWDSGANGASSEANEEGLLSAHSMKENEAEFQVSFRDPPKEE